MPWPFSHRAPFRALALFPALAQGDVSARAPFMASVQGRVGARGTDLGRFCADLGSIWGGGEGPGTSAGPSRGALFANLTFFSSEVDLWLILPLPRSLWRALWPPLGALWAALVPLGTPLWAPKGALGVAWGPSWGAFWRSWATLGPLKAPGTPW